MATKTINDDVMHLRRGEAEEFFTYEEWACVRYMWTGTGQRTGAIGELFGGEDGELADDGIEMLEGIMSQTDDSLIQRELHSNMQHGTGSGLELFELIKKKWKLPYRHVTDSSDTVKLGTTSLGNYGDPTLQRLPRLGDVSAFRSGQGKILKLLGDKGGGKLQFRVIGTLYLAQRR